MRSEDYTAARVRLSVCPSVRLSHATILSKSLNLFPPLGNHTILVFQYETVWQYSDEGRRMHGGMKNRDFWLISCYISETAIEGEQETVPGLSNGNIFNDIEWPLTQIIGQI